MITHKTMEMIVLLLIFGAATAELCGDVDTTLCNMMINRIQDTCSDPCLSKFCKHSCGMCALQCYDCVDIDDPTTCTSFKTCPNVGEFCFSAQTFTSSLKLAYRMGCATNDTCAQFTGNKRRGISFEAGCCNKDKCNNNNPTQLNIVPLPVVNVSLPELNGLCFDKAADICTRFSTIFHDPCDYSCVRSLCPHMCQQCFSCLACNEISSASLCSDNIVCGNGSVCYGYEKLNSRFEYVVELGCMDAMRCQELEQANNHPFGKRDFSLVGGCCIGDRCNQKPVGTHTTTTPTSVPITTRLIPLSTTKRLTTTGSLDCPNYSNCPNDFLPHGSYCYHIGTQSYQRDPAESYCQRKCAHLVKFGSKTEILEVFSYFKHVNHEVFTSLSKHPSGYWYWTSDDTTASSQMLENDFNLTKDACAIAYISFHIGLNSYPVYTYGMTPVNCSSTAKPMCYIPRAG